MRLNIQDMVLERENFDRWLLADVRFEEEHREHLNDLLRTRVGVVARMHSLTDAQRAKLMLAGRGDIKRLFDMIHDRWGGIELVQSGTPDCKTPVRSSFPAAA